MISTVMDSKKKEIVKDLSYYKIHIGQVLRNMYNKNLITGRFYKLVIDNIFKYNTIFGVPSKSMKNYDNLFKQILYHSENNLKINKKTFITFKEKPKMKKDNDVYIYDSDNRIIGKYDQTDPKLYATIRPYRADEAKLKKDVSKMRPTTTINYRGTNILKGPKNDVFTDDKINVNSFIIKFCFYYDDNKPEYRTTDTRAFYGYEHDVLKFCELVVENWMNDEPTLADFEWEIVSITPIGTHTGGKSMTYLMEERIIKEKQPFDISNIYGEQIELNESVDNCALNYALTRYKERIQPTKINTYFNSEKITCQHIKKFCNDYNIKLRLFKPDGTILHENDKTSTKLKPWVALVVNNHVYPMKKPILNKLHSNIMKYKYVNSADVEFQKLLYNKIVPTDIKTTIHPHTDKSTVISFVHNNTCYFNDKDFNKNTYDVNKSVFESFGITDIKHDSLTLTRLFKKIESLYCKQNQMSFFPAFELTPKPIMYRAIIDKKRKIKALDKNKFYSWALEKLNKLLVVDIRTAKRIKWNKNKLLKDSINDINDYNLYLVYLSNPCLFLRNGLNTGHNIKRAFNKGVPCQIIEEIETEQINNYFKDMINDVWYRVEKGEIDDKTAKDGMNRLIGSMIGKPKVEQKIITTQLIKVCESEATKQYISYNDEWNFETETVNIVNNIYNMLPVHIQILEEAHYKLYEKMASMGLTNKDIYGIKTDCIFFYDDNNKFDDVDFELTNYKIDGWKFEPNEKINDFFETDTYIDMFKNEIDIDDLTFDKLNIPNNNTLLLKYAGNGGSYDNINKLIPKIEKSNKSFVITSPTHATIKQYRTLNINAEVIQKYTITGKIPVEDVMIIDEVGLLDRQGHDFLIKMTYLNKQIYASGDIEQLVPYGEKKHICNDYYLKALFKTIKIKPFENWRNNFTKEEYDDMINTDWTDNTNNNKLTELLNEYCNHPNPKIIIAMTRETVQQENYKQLIKLGHMDESYNIISNLVGVWLICKTNKYGDNGIYNNFPTKIINYDPKTKKYVLDCGLTIDYKKIGYRLKDDKIDSPKDFIFGYCRTLFSCQGDEFTSIKFTDNEHDINLLKRTKGGVYTLISRIKNKDVKRYIILKDLNRNKKIVKKKIETRQQAFNKIKDKMTNDFKFVKKSKKSRFKEVDSLLLTFD